MPKFKNIRIKKRGGGFRTQRVRVLASGKYRFVKNIGSRVKKLTKRSKKRTRKRRNPNLARRRKRSRKKAGFKVPLATVLGLAAGFVGPSGDSPVEYVQKGDYRSALVRLGKSYTGYDANTGKWEPHLMASGVLPLVIGCLISMFVGGWPLNVNRRIKIPFIKI